MEIFVKKRSAGGIFHEEDQIRSCGSFKPGITSLPGYAQVVAQVADYVSIQKVLSVKSFGVNQLSSNLPLVMFGHALHSNGGAYL